MANVIVFKSPDVFAKFGSFCVLRVGMMQCGFCILKSFSVGPMYVSVVLLSLRVTVAW